MAAVSPLSATDSDRRAEPSVILGRNGTRFPEPFGEVPLGGTAAYVRQVVLEALDAAEQAEAAAWERAEYMVRDAEMRAEHIVDGAAQRLADLHAQIAAADARLAQIRESSTRLLELAETLVGQLREPVGEAAPIAPTLFVPAPPFPSDPPRLRLLVPENEVATDETDGDEPAWATHSVEGSLLPEETTAPTLLMPALDLEWAETPPAAPATLAPIAEPLLPATPDQEPIAPRVEAAPVEAMLSSAITGVFEAAPGTMPVLDEAPGEGGVPDHGGAPEYDSAPAPGVFTSALDWVSQLRAKYQADADAAEQSEAVAAVVAAAERPQGTPKKRGGLRLLVAPR